MKVSGRGCSDMGPNTEGRHPMGELNPVRGHGRQAPARCYREPTMCSTSESGTVIRHGHEQPRASRRFSVDLGGKAPGSREALVIKISQVRTLLGGENREEAGSRFRRGDGARDRGAQRSWLTESGRPPGLGLLRLSRGGPDVAAGQAWC